MPLIILPFALLLPSLATMLVWLGTFILSMAVAFLMYLLRKFSFDAAWKISTFLLYLSFVLLGTLAVFPGILNYAVELAVPNFIIVPGSWVMPSNFDNVISGVFLVKGIAWAVSWKKSFLTHRNQ